MTKERLSRLARPEAPQRRYQHLDSHDRTPAPGSAPGPEGLPEGPRKFSQYPHPRNWGGRFGRGISCHKRFLRRR